MQDVTDAFAAAKRNGVVPGSHAASLLAEAYRAAMSGYFHGTLSMQMLVARRYVTEDGFTQYYDQQEPGLAEWTKLVIEAYARANGIDPDTAAWEYRDLARGEGDLDNVFGGYVQSLRCGLAGGGQIGISESKAKRRSEISSVVRRLVPPGFRGIDERDLYTKGSHVVTGVLDQ